MYTDHQIFDRYQRYKAKNSFAKSEQLTLKDLTADGKISDKDFIDRAVSPRIESRLGCQCELKAGSGEIEVVLPDQTQFLGE